MNSCCLSPRSACRDRPGNIISPRATRAFSESEETMDPTRRIDMAGAEVSVVQGKIDVALSQFAQLYRNNSLVAEQLFPRVEVQRQSDLFWTFGRENQAIRENSLRAPGSAAERIQ